VKGGDLREMFERIGITQVEASKLLGVTSRAVHWWVTDRRKVPGPVKAYLRLLISLPDNLKAVELYRLRQTT